MAQHEAFAEQMGTVAQHHVAVGTVVAAGEQIMDIECMKVFFAVVSPVAGTIQSLAQLGQIVDANDAVAIIETE